MSRKSSERRTTGETDVAVELDLDGGEVTVETGMPFFDHMLAQLGRHGGLGLAVAATGDLDVDHHHTVEDVGITLGRAFRAAVGDRGGLRRFGWATTVLDEARATVALDLSGRPYLLYEVDTGGERILEFDPQLLEEFLRAFVTDAGITLHVRSETGRNPHHVCEVAFKGIARALSDALTPDPRRGGAVPSTKGMLA